MPPENDTPSAAPTPSSESSSPSSTPSAPASAPATESPSSADFDFSSLTHDNVDDRYVPPAKPVKEKEQPATPTPSAAAPSTAQPTASSPPVAPTPPAQPVATPAAPAAAPAQPATAAAAPATPAAETPPAEPVMTIEQHRAKFLPELQKLYALSDEEAEAVRTTPDKALPVLAARLHYEVQMASFNAIQQILPDIIGSILEKRKESDAADEQFYGKWPKLKDGAHKETVLNSIRAYRNANPKAPLDKIIEQAGIMAMISLGLPLELPGMISAAQPATPSAPVQTPAAPRPAGAGASGHQAPRAPSDEEENIFSALADAVVRGEA